MIEEIKSTEDAQQRFEEYFGKIDQIEDYANMLSILSSKDQFMGELECVSAIGCPRGLGPARIPVHPSTK
jgi:hypothetical protein